MSDDEGTKTAGQLVTEEALRVLPKTEVELAGREFGAALSNLGTTAREVTSWLKAVAEVPRGAVALVVRAINRWRRMPEGRRQLPPPQLLLDAAWGYAKTTDAELRSAFEHLIAQTMEYEAVSRVHPAFARNLSEMTPLEARMLRVFRKGGAFLTPEKLSETLGVFADAHAVTVAMTHMEGLGLVRADQFAVSALTGTPPPGMVTLGWQPREPSDSIMDDVDRADRVELTGFTGTYALTALGNDFVAVVSGDQ